jgi:hypothetical protein
MEWIRRIACFFGFHQYVPIRGSSFLYRQKELYIENQDYMRETELIISKLYCPHCGKVMEINIKK